MTDGDREEAAARRALEAAAIVADQHSTWALSRERLGNTQFAGKIVSGNIQRNQNARWIARDIRALDPAQFRK